MTLNDIIKDAIEELKDGWKDAQYPEDMVHEIADSSVPVYTYQLAQLAAEDVALFTDEPELGPAFDGSPTPANIVAANIYERVSQELFDKLYTLQAEAEEEELEAA
jgi:hypothetical protein